MFNYPRFFLDDKLEFQRAPYYHLPSFKEFKEESNKKLVKFTNDTKSLHLSSDESEESSRCSFSVLSDEIILKILENLDWKSLCRVSRVDKRLNKIAQDPHLYTYLKIDVNSKFDCNAIHTSVASERSLFHYFTPRCEYLRLLSLMGSCSEWSDIQKFLISCGRHLTHLQLCDCSWLNNFTLSQIVEICQDLKELNLGLSPLMDEGLSSLSNEGLLCLENLQFLECLCLLCININIGTLQKILRRNRRIRHLAFWFRFFDFSYLGDNFAEVVRNFCPDLESINLLNGLLTSEGIRIDTFEVGNSRNMCFEFCRKPLVDMFHNDPFEWLEEQKECSAFIRPSMHHSNWRSSFYDCFNKLLSSCQKLEKINLWYFVDINLKCMTTATCSENLPNCPKLDYISLSRNTTNLNETRNLFNQWIVKYSVNVYLSENYLKKGVKYTY